MNYAVFQMINNWAGRSDAADDVAEFAATWLIYLVFAVAAGLCAYALRRRRYRSLLLVAATLAVAFAAGLVLSRLNGELRPFQTHRVHQLIAHDGGVSLPSDHATAAFAVAASVGAFLHRRWGTVLAVAALVIGVARIWAGLHYPGDILAAAVIAAGAVLLAGAAGRLADRHPGLLRRLPTPRRASKS